MGHLQRSELVSAYKRMKRDAAGRSCSILILVAPTVDALCALKILTELLKCDFVPFKVVPVAGYDDIVAANDLFIQGRNEIRSVVLIDCGATVDLGELLSVSSEMMIYLVDSHRPYNLCNIFGNSQLAVLDDGFIEDNYGSLEQAFDATKFGEDDDDDDDDEEEEEERKGDVEGDESEEASAEEEDDAASDSSRRESDAERVGRGAENVENADPHANRRNRRLRQEERKAQRQYRRECRQKYIEYYRSGSWYGTAVARLLFDVSDALGRTCNDHLWCSILGITAQALMEQCGLAAYEAEVSWLRERCLQLNRDTSVRPSVPRRDSEPTEDYTSRDGRIRYEPEFRFMLTRHWTLFSSMLHSRYMATRLAVWRDKGRRLLETFIVKMGIPLAQCKLDYSSMDLELKESLPLRISKHAAEFGLNDVSMPSFVRDFGFVMRMSASDAVYALMALIEAPYAAMDLTASAVASERTSTETIWVSNFYYALDALDTHNIDKMRRGVQLAMKQQQIILHEATTILSHRSLRYGRRFRYVVLRHSTDITWLASHPLSLSKLVLFLADATRGSKRGHTPLLLAAYQPASDIYLIVASNTLRSAADGEQLAAETMERNRFGVAFRLATRRVRARVRHDGFDSAVIEVQAEDLKGFLHTLQSIPLS